MRCHIDNSDRGPEIGYSSDVFLLMMHRSKPEHLSVAIMRRLLVIDHLVNREIVHVMFPYIDNSDFRGRPAKKKGHRRCVGDP